MTNSWRETSNPARRPSQTALTAAAARAAHLLVDDEPVIGNSYVEQVAPAAAERGEPWLSFFSPPQMTALLSGHGFGGASHIAAPTRCAQPTCRTSSTSSSVPEMASR